MRRGSADTRSWPSATNWRWLPYPSGGEAALPVLPDRRRDLKAGHWRIWPEPFTPSPIPTATPAIWYDRSPCRNGTSPSKLFRKIIFTYGHRNVVRAVSSGLAQAAASTATSTRCCARPSRTVARTRIIRKSELLGFPPDRLGVRGAASPGAHDCGRRSSACRPSRRSARARHAAPRRFRVSSQRCSTIAAKMNLVRGLGRVMLAVACRSPVGCRLSS